jgi:hypothetical protein
MNRMTGNRRRYLSIAALAVVYSVSTIAIAGLSITAFDTSAKAAPHGSPHGGGPKGGGPKGGGPKGGGPKGGGPKGGGPKGGPKGGHKGHFFGGRPGWVHGHRYHWNSLWYCWYPVGYNGPGWYVCGLNQ